MRNRCRLDFLAAAAASTIPTPNSYKKIMRSLLNVCPLFALITMLTAGCATHEHRLNPIGSAPVVYGKMIHSNISTPDRLIVETANQHFTGDLVVREHVDWEKLRKTYRSNIRHWRRITSGLDKDHQTYIGTAELKSAGGEMLRCRLAWSRSDKPEGECTDQSGTSFKIKFD